MSNPSAARAKPTCFQELILTLQNIGQAGLRDPAALRHGDGRRHLPSRHHLARAGAEPWRAAYVQPSRRPKDGRYGENPNRLQHYYQFQVILKPSPPDILELYLGSLEAIGIDTSLHDIRFVEDDWESPTLGAWGLGWEVWCDGMEISQFTYFQQVGGIESIWCRARSPTGSSGWPCTCSGHRSRSTTCRSTARLEVPLTYGDVFQQNEQEQSAYNFELADTEMLFRHFADAEKECGRLIERNCRCRPTTSASRRALLQPAGCARRDQRDRAAELHRCACATLAKACCEAWLATQRVPTSRGGVMAELLLEFSERGNPGAHAGAGGRGSRAPRGDGLKAAGIAFTDARAFATPRRLALVVDGLPTRAAPMSAKKGAGPRVGAPRAGRAGLPESRRPASLDQARSATPARASSGSP